jgi:hypothetical protein
MLWDPSALALPASSGVVASRPPVAGGFVLSDCGDEHAAKRTVRRKLVVSAALAYCIVLVS